MNDTFALREATLLVYRADRGPLSRWRAEVLDKRSGASICRTARVPSRSKAMLDGAAHALDLGYLVTLGVAALENDFDDAANAAFSPMPIGLAKMGTAFAASGMEAACNALSKEDPLSKK